MKKLPDSELKIMMVIWEADDAVSTDYIFEKLNKDWTRQTLLKLLTRLEERGFVKFYKDKKLKVYSANVDKEEYLKHESVSFLDKLHFKSVTNLVASLYDGKVLSKEDLIELEEYIKGVI